MIVGPSGFPTGQKRKGIQTAHTYAFEEILSGMHEWRDLLCKAPKEAPKCLLPVRQENSSPKEIFWNFLSVLRSEMAPVVLLGIP